MDEDPRTGERRDWPVQYTDLEDHYVNVEQMLNVKPYPFYEAPYRETPKTRWFKAAAEEHELDWSLPNLAVSFARGPGAVPGQPIIPEDKDPPNFHNLPRYTCRLVGECDMGCNFGSKNSLDHNYLSAAKDRGAEIRTLAEVKEFEPLPDGRFAVHYVQREEKDPEQEQQKTITADRLILAAGTLGSTYLLLKMKNRGKLPGISERLGTRFSTNGDLISFALKSRELNGEPRVIDADYGPVITSTVRVPDKEDNGVEGRGAYVQEAGYPGFVSWMLHDVNWLQVGRIVLDRWLTREADTDVGAEVSQLFGETELSAGSLPLLGMGRDTPDGTMRLRDEKLDLDWSIKNSRGYFSGVRKTMVELSQGLGAKFADPRAAYLITVHPLGGCPMGRNQEEGVVDSYGKVFGYDNLYVADGSIMPGPVGANPSLTIAALADRFAAKIRDNIN